MMRKWLKRIIIPMYKNSNLIFYQGRDLSGTAQKKYQSPSTDAAKVLYGFDNLHNYKVNEPLYVVEGWFDAFLYIPPIYELIFLHEPNIGREEKH